MENTPQVAIDAKLDAALTRLSDAVEKFKQDDFF
jgi:hypothetical protein